MDGRLLIRLFLGGSDPFKDLPGSFNLIVAMFGFRGYIK